MQFEVIRKSHKKEIIIGVSLLIILGVVLIARYTFAKYELVKSIKIAEGTINYKVPDFKIMAMYKNDGNGYVEIETMPESGYAINETKSYCKLNGSKDSNARVYTDEDGQHIISAITKGSRCYIYFDNYKKVNTALGEITVKLSTPDFSKTSCTSGCEESTVGIYQAKDDDGWSYYYRGDVENNYVKFAGKYWRIIRINGDGTIRMIYDGTSLHANGTGGTDSKIVGYYSEIYDSKEYVGFKYTLGEEHGNSVESTILKTLNNWYITNLISYENKIDINAGFCSDRTPGTLDNDGDYRYGGKGLSLDCEDERDYYTNSKAKKGNKSLTYSIGTITSNELIYAGIKYGTKSNGNYLLTSYHYWTMTPLAFYTDSKNGTIYMFYGYEHNFIGSSGTLTAIDGIRPVINLKADISITGTGTMTDPYIVN